MACGEEMVLISTGESFVIHKPIFETPVEYPSDWFTANKNSKPPITIKLSNESSLTQSRSWAYAVALGRSSNVYCAVEYLYHVFGTIKDNIATDWVSYGVRIPKGEVTPLSLLNVTVEKVERTITLNQPVELPETDDIGLVMYLAGLFRIARTDKRYQDTVAERISPSITAVVSSKFMARINTNRINAPLLVTLSEIETLFSALDMFLERFPKNVYSKCRIGTVILRDVGFSAFNDINYLTDFTGCANQEDAFEWLMTPAAGKELKQIMIKEEEFCTPYSYLPYAMGLKISNKSPFSAAANPNIHFTVHVVGSLVGSERSINAIMGKNIKIIPCSMNAALIFLKSKGTSHLIPQELYGKNAADIKKRNNQAEGNADDPTEEISHNACDAALDFLNRGNKFTYREIEVLKGAASKIKDPRKGSIGKWVKNNFISSLPIKN